MNARLKQLAASRGLSIEKLQHLVNIIGEADAEDVILRAQQTEKSADALGVAYKSPSRASFAPREADRVEALCDGLSERDADRVWDVYVRSGYTSAVAAAKSIRTPAPSLKDLIERALTTWDGR